MLTWIDGLNLKVKVLAGAGGCLLAMLAIGVWSAWQVQTLADAFSDLFEVVQLDPRMEADLADVADEARRRMLLIGVLPAAVTVLGFSLALLFVQRMLRTVNAVEASARQIAGHDLPSLVRVAEALAAGDLTQHAEVTVRPVDAPGRDEFGRMAQAVNTMIASLQDAARAHGAMRGGLRELVSEVQAAAGVQAQAAAAISEASVGTADAVQQVGQAVDGVARGASDAAGSARATSDAVQQMSQAIEGVARGATEQAEQVESASRTATQMAAGVEQVAASASGMAAASQQTRAAADHGAAAVQETIAGMAEIRQVVGQAAEKVSELGKLGQKIGAVVETIDDIAEQTNLLALNAAIEAARAGEHGRGFAVVADEVRKLAERSQRETRQIADLIAQVQNGTGDAVHAMEAGAEKVQVGTARADQAGQALAEIRSAVEDTVRRVSEIAASAQEMSAAAHGVTGTLEAISAVVAENTAATEEMTAQAGQVAEDVRHITAVAEEQGAATQQVSASTQQMGVHVAEMSARAQELAATARQLQTLVARFRVDAEEDDAAARPGQPGASGRVIPFTHRPAA